MPLSSVYIFINIHVVFTIVLIDLVVAPDLSVICHSKTWTSNDNESVGLLVMIVKYTDCV